MFTLSNDHRFDQQIEGIVASENEINTRWLNALLARIFAFDVWAAPRLRPRFGVSILAVARCPNAA